MIIHRADRRVRLGGGTLPNQETGGRVRGGNIVRARDPRRERSELIREPWTIGVGPGRLRRDTQDRITTTTREILALLRVGPRRRYTLADCSKWTNVSLSRHRGIRTSASHTVHARQSP